MFELHRRHILQQLLVNYRKYRMCEVLDVISRINISV